MKKLYLLALAGLLSVFLPAQAQQLRTAYFLDGTPARMALNPALRPMRGYVNIPGVGALNVAYGTNTLTLDKLLYPRNGKLVTFLDESVPASEFLGSLKNDNRLNADIDLSILGFGFYSGKGFWSFDLGLRNSVSGNLPKEIFQFLKEGSSLEGRRYHIEDLDIDVTSYLQASLGYSRPINDRLTVGGKIKFLAGIAQGRMEYNQLDLTMTDQQWAVEADGQFNLILKGVDIADKEGEEEGKHILDLGSLDFGTPGPAGYGFGIDLGAEYRLLPNLRLSAAIIDLGMIRWNAKNGVGGRSVASYYFNGFDIVNGVDQSTTSSAKFDDFTRFERSDAESTTTTLKTTFVLGGEYSILQDKIGFGLLFTSQKRAFDFLTEVTVSANFRPLYWFSASLSYSLVNSKFNTYGLALNFHPSWINFFIGTDYMPTHVTKQFMPIKQKRMDVYFGLSIPVGKAHTERYDRYR